MQLDHLAKRIERLRNEITSAGGDDGGCDDRLSGIIVFVVESRRARDDGGRFRGPYSAYGQGLERAADSGKIRQSRRSRGLYCRWHHCRPAGLPEARPDGQWHNLGPRRLSRPRFYRTSWPSTSLVASRVSVSVAVTLTLHPRKRPQSRAPSLSTLKANRYDPESGTLALPAGAAESFNGQVKYWKKYFDVPERNGGLARETVSDPRALRQLSAFFAWTAWASAATRPGTSHSYTNNFPYEPLAGNTPTPNALIYSALSLVFLLGG